MRNARKVFTATLVVLAMAATGCSTSGQAMGATTPTAAAAPAPTKRVVPPPPALPSRPSPKSLEAIVEGIVLASSKQQGAILSSAEWKSLSSTICRDLSKGGTGLFLAQTATSLPEDKKWGLSDLYLDGAIEGSCKTAKKPPAPPGRYYGADIGWNIIYSMKADLDDADLEYKKSLVKYADDLVAYGGRYNVDVTGLLAVVDAYFGSGGTVTCSDGWVSSSGGKQGACSHHGGVK